MVYDLSVPRSMTEFRVRAAQAADDAAVSALDRATWSQAVSPVPRPRAGSRAFGDRLLPGDTLVAEAGDGRVVGYIALGRPTPVASNAHVLEVRGLAVDPALQRRGIARALLRAAAALARDRGARRLTLRVFATNPGARALYASEGFVEEGVLRGEFHIGGRDVDDHLLALDLQRRS